MSVRVIRPRLDLQDGFAAVVNDRPTFTWGWAGEGELPPARVRVNVDRGALRWDSGEQTLTLPRLTYDGPPLPTMARLSWTVNNSEPQHAFVAPRSSDEWPAEWIGSGVPIVAGPMPIFRKTFTIDGEIASATLLVCALGHGETRINGVAVESRFTPAWTDYDKTVSFNVHDVTSLLHSGQNTIGVMLGNGMYRVVGERYRKFKRAFGEPILRQHLRIELRDGRTIAVPSDEAWRWIDGPIAHSCIYGGEDHDARLEPAGWDKPGFDDSTWKQATIGNSPRGKLVPQRSPMIALHESFAAKRTPIDGTTTLFDFGQNAAAVPEITTNVPLVVRPGELLDEHGRVKQKHTGSPVSFRITPRENELITWTPRFSFTGFRYVEVVGPTDASFDVASRVVSSSARKVGSFECDVEIFNRIDALIGWAVRSNLHNVMTDCPHREKLGWLEQTHLMGRALFASYDVAAIYRKLMGDLLDAQRDDGSVPTTAPQYTSFKPPWDVFNDSPEWGVAIVHTPLLIHRATGDLNVLREHFPAMRRYVDYLTSRADADGIVRFGLSDWYDLGENKPGFCQLTSMGVTATATLLEACETMAEAATRVGDDESAREFTVRGTKVIEAFNAAFWNEDEQHYDTGSQTAQAMPIVLPIARGVRRIRAFQALVRDIESRGNHTTAGDIGFRYVIDALCAMRRPDLAAAMMTNPTPPSYAAQLAAGATALSESWDANPTSSHNHFMLGHGQIFLYERIGGLTIDLGRDVPITIQPTPVGGVSHARVTRQCEAGDIAIEWTLRDDKITLDATIPPGLSASIRSPAGQQIARLDGGRQRMNYSIRRTSVPSPGTPGEG